MFRLLLLALVAHAAVAAPSKSACAHRNWKQWLAQKANSRCGAGPCETLQLPPVPPGGYDRGEEARLRNMARKQQMRDYIKRCREDGSCPDMDVPNRRSRTECEDGTADEYPCRNIHMESFVPIIELNNGYGIGAEMEGNDIWGWHDDVADEDYAIVGLTGGTSFVRISDPQNPFVVGFLPTHGNPSIWRDMKVNGDWVFIVAEIPGHGMAVFDLTRLRGVNEFTEFAPDTSYHDFGHAHNIAVNTETDTVYVVGSRYGGLPTNCENSGGLHIIDVSDPLNPVRSGCFDADGYFHDTECIIYRGPDTEHYGREICFGYNENSFTVVDVTDRESPVMLSRSVYSGYRYTHQGWITPDHTIVLLDDELDEYETSNKYTRTYMWDVRDLDSPQLRRTYQSTETAIDHNQYIRRYFGDDEDDYVDLTFQSNYEAGLRVLEIQADDEPDDDDWGMDLNEVAYFDVLPSKTTADFYGTWSNYPYYQDETLVVVNSIDYGLFVLRLDLETIDEDRNRNC